MRNFIPGHRSIARASGFTLLELMIVLVIMAILVASAVAAYDFAVVKSRRSAAASCLMEAAQAMERRYTTALAYNVPNTPPTCSNINQLSGFYNAPTFFGTVAARTYVLQIVPTVGGAQAAKDTKCGTLRVSQAGTKTKTGTAANASECF